MASLAEEISRLTNTAPIWGDPEDIIEGAKLTQRDEHSAETNAVTVGPSKLRKRTAQFDEEDVRYKGKKISRKSLESDGDSERDNSGEAVESEDEDGSGGDEDEKFVSFEDPGDYDDSISGDSDDDDDGDSDGHGDDENDMLFDETNQLDQSMENADDDGISKLTVSQDDKEKGQAVQNQLNLWEMLLKSRIEMQKVMSKANQLPQPDTWKNFVQVGGQTYTLSAQQAKLGISKVLQQLVNLQTALLANYKDAAHIVSTGSKDRKQNDATGHDDEISSDSEVEEEDPESKPSQVQKQLKMSAYPDFVANRHSTFSKFRDDTIQKWYDKTRVFSGKLSKGFTAFDQSTIKQIRQILSDKERLIKRTQLKRSSYRVLGTHQAAPSQDEANPTDTLPSREHLKEYDEEIFDDDDFYHQILRELIESKSRDINNPVAITRHWLEIQKLRSKRKKKVDTRASKGRKIRYEVHPKMVNFMAAMETSSWTDEAKNDLYSSLFGKHLTT